MLEMRQIGEKETKQVSPFDLEQWGRGPTVASESEQRVVMPGELVLFRRVTRSLALAFQGPDGIWYADDCHASTLRALLQVVLSHTKDWKG